MHPLVGSQTAESLDSVTGSRRKIYRFPHGTHSTISGCMSHPSPGPYAEHRAPETESVRLYQREGLL